MKNFRLLNYLRRIPALWPIAVLVLLSGVQGHAAPNFLETIERPLRYSPQGDSFVVTNGEEFFNRPLYGSNTAFRVDAGDKPEYSFYMPGRGGNLRFGVKTSLGQKWLNDAASIITRYRPGSMLHEIRDPLLGSGTLHLRAVGINNAEGLIISVELQGSDSPVTLVWAYGGANGARHSRNGDIGTDRMPMSKYFQFKSDSAAGQKLSIEESSFALHGKRVDIVGLASSQAKLAIGDATKWTSVGELLASEGKEPKLQVIVGQVTLKAQRPFFLSIERVGGGTESQDPVKVPSFQTADLPATFRASEHHRRSIADQVVVNTPDPYINAAVPALNIAADGIWDESQSAIMHGAVAWRSKLLGWRGPYSGDALGWHKRTRRHLMNWLPKQTIGPTPVFPFPQDGKVNFARNEPMLHTDGALTKSHYDMNMPAIDILFRHFLWTGDLAYARDVWPVIERHLAWERRLFRRPFGPDKLPLYEAYAAIWASDDLQYNGSGVTHSSAYLYYHNTMASRLATLLRKDATPYKQEAALILKAMRRELWLTDRGWYGESRDLLGLRRVHPNAALWTFYHTVDSQIPTAHEAWQMTRFVDTQIPHFPLRGPGVPSGNYYTLSTTSWMPYTWSINNVAMAEASHTALGYWQAGRSDEAFRLFKGLILDSMYIGLCPGNVGMTTAFDMARGEAQRDSGDPIGINARTVIEGLFGVQADALAGELHVRPGFPSDWEHASIKHPDFDCTFQRVGHRDTYVVAVRFPRPMALRLRVAAPRESIAGVTVNGKHVKWNMVEDSIGVPRIEIQSEAAPHQQVVIAWKGRKPATATVPTVVARGAEVRAQLGAARLREIFDPQKALSKIARGTNSLRATATGSLGHRSVFVRVGQGDLRWWLPVTFEIRPRYEIIPALKQNPGCLRFQVRNNSALPISQTIVIRSGNRNFRSSLKVPAFGESSDITLAANEFIPGSNRILFTINDKAVEGVVTNWNIKANPSIAKWNLIDLTPFFNEKVTRIFQNEYVSPRSPYVSLSVPKQGIGSWVHWDEKFAVDDRGLRAIATINQDRLLLPQGVPLATPGTGDTKNIAFTSRWENFPTEITIPLVGKASHAYFLMAGSTNWMQSRFDNGEIVVTYSDGATERLALHNPTTWWPIDQDYKIDDYAFRRPEPIPPRVDLKSGQVRVLDLADFKGQGGKVQGGAATVLDLPLQPKKTLKSLTLRTLANEVIIGLMATTLVKP